jgi:hypothetical protein
MAEQNANHSMGREHVVLDDKCMVAASSHFRKCFAGVFSYEFDSSFTRSKLLSFNF